STATLHPGVVCGQHGWWQPASELGQPGYPAFGEGSANLNLVLSQGPSDPISGSSPLRASLCEVAQDNGWFRIGQRWVSNRVGGPWTRVRNHGVVFPSGCHC